MQYLRFKPAPAPRETVHDLDFQTPSAGLEHDWQVPAGT
jgi:hypothetical protein